VKTNTEFAASFGADYPVLADPGKAVAKAYGVVGALMPWASRWTFYIGLDGRILYVDRDVKAATAGADIAARLAQLGVARRK
jgi:peroxiredoxin Q/BCP